jgi:hypothetical protein
LNGVNSVAVDAAGDLLIADMGNNRVREVNASGVINTVAGNGLWGGGNDCPAETDSFGDGCQATVAPVASPAGVAVDGNGNIYIAQPNLIREVAPSGIITTIAGNVAMGPGFSGDGGPATSAQLDNPQAVTLDSAGDLIIADTRRIRGVNLAGTISTIAGNGDTNYFGDDGPATSAGLDLPYGVAIDGEGNLSIAEQNNNRVRKVDPSGTITTVAGTGLSGYTGDGGAATAATLNTPRGLAVDGSGNLSSRIQGTR